MNYLAHALLAEPHRFSIIGNIAGDLVKGRLEDQDLHPRVAEGVRRHRRVDALTDAHPRYRALVGCFPLPYRRVAPIVLDVLFDHYLYGAWRHFTSLDRDAFISGVYAVLTAPQAPLPPALATRASLWVDADWLHVYRSIEGVEAVLTRLAARSRRALPIMPALAAARDLDEVLRSGFAEVFDDVRVALDGLPGPPIAYTARLSKAETSAETTAQTTEERPA